MSCRIVKKCVNTPDLLKHYKILVNRALTEAKRTKCTWSAEEMRFYAKVINFSKHTVMRKNTIKHKEIMSENRVESVICLNQTSICLFFWKSLLGVSHDSILGPPELHFEATRGPRGLPRAAEGPQEIPGSSQDRLGKLP